MQITGFTLLSRRQVLVRGYVMVLGVLAVGIGLWAGSDVLPMLGAFMLGAYLSTSMPIWRNVEGEKDQRYIDHLLKAPVMPNYYWLLPVLIVAYGALVVAAKIGSM